MQVIVRNHLVPKPPVNRIIALSVRQSISFPWNPYIPHSSAYSVAYRFLDQNPIRSIPIPKGSLTVRSQFSDPQSHLTT